jgi:hypothetical protein
VDDVDEAVDAVFRAVALDRAKCRLAFEQRFTATRMARDYLRLYQRGIDELSGEKGQVAMTGMSSQ